MKFAADRPYADPEAAARKLVEIANSVAAIVSSPEAYTTTSPGAISDVAR